MMTAADRRYLEELVQQEQGRLLGFIRKRVGDEEDARDIMQDVLYQLTAGFDDIRSASRITAWIFAVARNRITDYFRKQRDVFILNEFEDMSFREISGITGEGINTLLSRKRYAVKYLREQLHDLYEQLKTG